MNPRILVSCEDEEHVLPYVAALRAAGCEATDILCVHPPELAAVSARCGEADAALLCGGPDVEPHHYGQEPRPNAGLKTMPELDALDRAVLERAQASTLPVFAICRGMQMLNVFLGGNLWQDLRTQLPEPLEHRVPEPRDRIAHALQPRASGHSLARALEQGIRQVNSRHHQAVRDPAPGMSVLATAPDDVIEAIAGPDVDPRDGWWLRGVQWHPENLVADRGHLQLFVDFLEAARRRNRRAA